MEDHDRTSSLLDEHASPPSVDATKELAAKRRDLRTSDRRDAFPKPIVWLDCSNAKLSARTFAVAMEVTDSLAERTSSGTGCGVMDDHVARPGGVAVKEPAVDRGTFWESYYHELFAKPIAWLDCSNARVQSQAFAVALESAGPLDDRRCLDVGCGRGFLSLHLAAGRASEVVGIDIIEEGMETCRLQYPHIRWETGTAEDPAFLDSLGDFDIVFAVEILQLLPLEATIRALWNRVRPGGRLVAVLANGECPIVQRTMARFQGAYMAPSPADMKAILTRLSDVECWAYRGMAFQADQRIAPYAVSDWTTEDRWAVPPNRLAYSIVKAS